LIIFDSISLRYNAEHREATERRVIDRTQLNSRYLSRACPQPEGQLQVEIGAIELHAASLTGKGTAMSRLGAKDGWGVPVERAAEREESACRVG